MATNIIYDRILKGLKTIIGNRAIIADSDSPKSSEYTLLSMASSPELIENTGPSISMLYSVNIDIMTNKARKSRYLSQAVSDVLDSLNANPAYTTGGVYYWHDGQVLTSEYGSIEEEGYAHRILWTATHTEVKGV